MRITIALGSTLLLSGCATVMNDSTHPLRVDTVTEDGRMIAGADCEASNDKAHARFRSGEMIQVRRSARDLDITCRHPDHPMAVGRATSRANAGMWGNIIAGGAIGAVVDHNKGTAYTYPTWVQVVFGWVTAFDRRGEDAGAPVSGERVARTEAQRPVEVADGAEGPQQPEQPNMNWQWRGF